MKSKMDFEPDDNPCVKLEETYLDYVADYDSVKDEHWDGVDDVKMDNQLEVEIKSEILDAEQSVETIKLENIDASAPNEDIKYEYDEDVSDSKWNSAQIKKQWEKEEDKKLFSCYICNYTDNCKKGLVVHIKRNNCHLGSNLRKSQSVSRKPCKLNVCIKCNEVFKSKALLDNHMIREHDASASSKIYECILCDHIFVNESHFTRHMLRHTSAKVSDTLICKHCNTLFNTEQLLFDHILKKHPNFSEEFSTNTHTYESNSITRTAKRNHRKPFACINCDASFIKKESLDDHILKKHPERASSVSHTIHECTHCEYKTARLSHITAHMIQHTRGKFKCTECDASLESKRSLDNHFLQKHNSETRKIMKCTQCEYKTTFARCLSTHMLTHTGTKCTKCYASFGSERSLSDHILRKHPELTASVSLKIHECTHCQYKTTYDKNLTIHMLKHSGAKVACSKCNVSYTTIRALESHILKKHPELTASLSYKIHECIHCQYKCMYPRDLARHMMKHSGDRLTCTKCDVSFMRKESLDNHIIKKHPEIAVSVSQKVHECTDCDYKTACKENLARHMMKHTGAKLTCTECGAPYTTKLWLDNHILQKHPQCTASVSRKVHECTHCEYKTTHLGNLTSHMEKHTGGELTCTKCDTSFTSKQSLNNHISQTHPQSADPVSHKVHYTENHTESKFNCTKCDASLKSKKSLDNHVLQKHPLFATSVTRKIKKCTQCEYKTIYTSCLSSHMMKHAGTKFTCTKCDASFTFERSLADHVVKKHPEFAASVTHKIHECTQCEYKSMYARDLGMHMAKHT